MSEPARIRYRFDLPDGSTKTLDFLFDAADFALLNPPPAVAPFWTELQFNQCANCPLDAAAASHCPPALQMARSIEALQSLVSFDTVAVTVTQDDRKVSVETTAQAALASVFGLVMATAGCPWADHLRPMARFHLPFAGELETVYRALSMYALAQHAWREDAHGSFVPLERVYENLRIVNRDFARRLGAASKSDPARNAIALLDAFAMLLPDAVGKSLQDIAPLFAAWSRPAAAPI